jgi:hypothetical protein
LSLLDVVLSDLFACAYGVTKETNSSQQHRHQLMLQDRGGRTDVWRIWVVAVRAYSLEGARSVGQFAPNADVGTGDVLQGLGLAIEAIDTSDLLVNSCLGRCRPVFVPTCVTLETSLASTRRAIFGMAVCFAANESHEIDVLVRGREPVHDPFFGPADITQFTTVHHVCYGVRSTL